MPRRTGGFIGHRGLQAPDPPTAVTPTAGNAQVSVAFTAPSDVGDDAITAFVAQTNTSLLFSSSYASKSFNVSSQAGGAGGVQFKSDGTKMYVTGQASDKTFQYSLSTAYDVSTASYDSVELNHATQVSNANPYDLFFKTDGTKLYVMFGVNDTVYQYGLSTAWDLSTASYDSVNFSVASQESGEPGGLAFSDDGSNMYIVGEGQATVFQYTLSTAWDLSSASYSSKSLDVSAQGAKPSGLAFALSGKVMVISKEASVSVDVYYLKTAFNVTTASYSYRFDVSSQDPRPWYVALADSNTKMYVGGPNNDTVYQYTVSFAEDAVYGVSGSSSPLTITGLTNGGIYTTRVFAINDYGTSAPSEASASFTPATRGLFAGGDGASNRNVIEFITVSSTGNSTDFGDLLHSGSVGNQSASSSTRALFGGGNNVNRDADQLTLLQYVTIATTGNASDFGDFTGNRLYTSSLSNEARGVFVGEELNNPADTMEYLTIASLGNSTDFGNLTTARSNMGSGSNTTRGVSGGGNITDGTAQNIIDYITIASAGNSTDFGDLTQARKALVGCSSTARTCFIGGSTGSNVNTIDFVTTASTGNATDFGDLATAVRNHAALSSKIRGVSAGGESATNDMQYITIASAGNSSTFGNLLSTKHSFSGCSSGHGGLA